MNKWLTIGFMFLFATGAILALNCGGDSDNTDNEKACSVGSLGCDCVNDKCNSGLECKEGKCVAEAVDTETEEDKDTETKEERNTDPTKSDIELTNDGAGKLCAKGVVVGPSDNDGWESHWGAGFGLNLCQSESNASKTPLGECPSDLSRLIGFRLTVTGQLPSELRIQFEDNFEGSDTVKGDNGYIVAEVLDTQKDYLFSEAAVFYLPEADRPQLNPELFTSLQIQIASHLGDIEYYDFCVQDIELILSDNESDAGDAEDAEDTPEIPEPNDDPYCADPTSIKIIPNQSNWVAGCSNAIGLQGDVFTYSDPG